MPSFEILSAELRSAGALAETAELHGQLCGLLCQLGPAAVPPWLVDALSGASGPESARNSAQSMLADLADGTAQALDNADMSLGLLLPADSASLDSRAESLSFWCQGFLHGLSAAAADPGVSRLGYHGRDSRRFCRDHSRRICGRRNVGRRRSGIRRTGRIRARQHSAGLRRVPRVGQVGFGIRVPVALSRP